MTLIRGFNHVEEDVGHGVEDVVKSDALRHTHRPSVTDCDVSRSRRVTPRLTVDRDLPPTMSFFQPHAAKAARKQPADPQNQPWVEK